MDIKLLPKIIRLPDGKDVILEVESLLKETYNNNYSTDYDNYIYFENKNSNTLLQAHIDTVKREEKIDLYMGNGVIFTDGVLGGDDRAGVWGIVKLVEMCVQNKLDIPNILLTNYEESGSGGMKVFLESCINNLGKFNHINMAIAMDRHGCGHYVTYCTLSKEVEKYMTSFGWSEQHGTFSDISLFTDEYLIPSVNVAVGYHSEHTKNETLNVDELVLSVNRVYKMLRSPIKQLYPVKKKVVYVAYGWREINCWWNKKEEEKDDKVVVFTPKKAISFWGTCDFCQEKKLVKWYTEIKKILCEECHDFISREL